MKEKVREGHILSYGGWMMRLEGKGKRKGGGLAF